MMVTRSRIIFKLNRNMYLKEREKWDREILSPRCGKIGLFNEKSTIEKRNLKNRLRHLKYFNTIYGDAELISIHVNQIYGIIIFEVPFLKRPFVPTRYTGHSLQSLIY